MGIKIRRDQRGQIVALTAVCTMVLMACMALAIDVGLLFRAKRKAQIAADAAAVAAGLDYKYNSSLVSARTAGQSASAANGITNGTGGAVVAINIPPQYGSFAGSSGYVEAVVTQPNPTIFMSMFSLTSVTVGAKAVVSSGANHGCIWTLAKSGIDVSLTGSGALTARNCNIYDDSAASDALTLTGSGSVSAAQIGIVGSYSDTGSGTITPHPPTTGIAPAADPLTLTAPSIPSGTCSSNCNPNNSTASPMTLQPGTYTSITNSGSGTLTLAAGNYIITGDLKNTGSGSLVLGAGNYTIGGNFQSTGSSSITLGSGLYTIGGNLSLTGSGPMTGTSVTFYTQGSTTIQGSGSMNLTAPTSGTYSGVLLYQPPTDSGAVQLTGSGGDKVQGILYAPDSTLTLTGSGSMTVSLDIIVDSLKVSGSGSITDTNYATVTNTNSVLSKLVMVE